MATGEEGAVGAKKQRSESSNDQRGKVSANWEDREGVSHQEFFDDTEEGIKAAFERLKAPDVAKWIGVKRRGRDCLEMPLSMDQVSTIAWGFQAGKTRAYLCEVASVLYIQSDSFDKLWASMVKDRRERRMAEKERVEARRLASERPSD